MLFKIQILFNFNIWLNLHLASLKFSWITASCLTFMLCMIYIHIMLFHS